MHYLFVFGTRPEAIKLLPLAITLRKRGERVTLLSTSQHTDLLVGVLEAFGLSSDITLPPPPKERSLDMLVRFFVAYLPRYIREISPDAVVVQGDTVSAFCGAFTAFLLDVHVIHIEAGLRTYQRKTPYPEEALRRMITPLATVHFATTEKAREHLLAEGVREHVYTVGNTVTDAMRFFCPQPKRRNPPYALVTTHRRENDGEVREGIFRAISRLANTHSDLAFFVVLNENKSIQSMAYRMLSERENIELLLPRPLKDFYSLLSGASLVLTDSGGVSEEGAVLGLSTFVLRDTTEREWEWENGKITLVGTDEEGIFRKVSSFIKKGIPTEKGSVGMPEGSVSEQIVEILQRITL